MIKQVLVVLVVFLGLASAQYVTLQQFQCMFPNVKAAKVNSWLPSLNQSNTSDQLAKIILFNIIRILCVCFENVHY
jgi:hypothetical protein